MRTAPEAEFTQAEGVELATGLVHIMATERSLSYLLIKGDTAMVHGLREKRVSADVDVLLRPADVEPLVLALEDRGWLRRPEGRAAEVFSLHGVDLYHPSWPCDIDIHHRVPGFDIEPELAFESLRQEAVVLRRAGHDVHACGPAGTLLVTALNALRSHPHDVARWDDLVSRARARLRPDDVVDLAARTGSLASLRPFLEEAFPEAAPGKFPAPSPEWIVSSMVTEPAVHRLLALEQVPLRRWPSFLFRALAPGRQDLASVDLGALEDGPWRNTCRRVRRLALAAGRSAHIWSEYRLVRRALAPTDDARGAPLGRGG